MSAYPDRWHPVYFLEDALRKLGADATFARDERTEDCYGLVVNGRVVVWLIDNRLPHEQAVEDPAAERLMGRGALVLCAQQPDAARIGAVWLPLAVSPGFAPDACPATHDAAFVGYVRDPARASALIDVAGHCRLHVAQGVFGQDAADVYNRARVGLNVPTEYGARYAYDSANMRCFEVLGCGVALVTPDAAYLAELGLVDGDTCYTYASPDMLVPTVRRALADPLREAVAAAGCALAQTRHTYRQRAQQVLAWLR